MIKLKEINKTYSNNNTDSKIIFNNLNITFNQKGLYYITGSNGSGKTTLLNILMGIDQEYQGSYYFNNDNISKLTSKEVSSFRNNNISVVSQFTNLINEFTVYNNLYISIKTNKISKDEKNNQIKNVLNKVGLKNFENRIVSSLSAGERQRIAIARALLNTPKILLADEITSNLDKETAYNIMEIIKELSKDYLIIMITHDNNIVKDFKATNYHILNKQINTNNHKVDITRNDNSLNIRKSNIDRNIFIIIKDFFISHKNIKLFYVFLLLIILILTNFFFSSTFSNNKTSTIERNVKSSANNGLLSLELRDNNKIDNKYKIYSKDLNVPYKLSQNNKSLDVRTINLIDDFLNYFKVTGEIPNTYNEVILTDYHLYHLDINYEDITNKELELRVNEEVETFKVVGVLDTNYSDLIKEPSSNSLNNIIKLNEKSVYNSIYVTKKLFDNYKHIEDTINLAINPTDKEQNIQLNTKSLKEDILVGKPAISKNEIVLSYYSIKQLFVEFKDIEQKESELIDVFNIIKNKAIKLSYYDNDLFEYVQFDFVIVGINHLKKSNNGISEVLLASLTKKDVNPTEYILVNNITKKLINTISKNNTYIKDLSVINESELGDKYTNYETLINIISMISLLALILLFVLILILSYIRMNTQENNIKTLKLIGYKKSTITNIYVLTNILIVTFGALFSFIINNLIVNLFNNSISKNKYNLNYIMLLSKNNLVIAQLIVVILITYITTFLAVVKLYNKNERS